MNTSVSACIDEILERSLGGKEISTKEILKVMGRYNLNKGSLPEVQKALNSSGISVVAEDDSLLNKINKYIS